MEISIHAEMKNPPNFERDSGLLPCFLPSECFTTGFFESAHDSGVPLE